MIILCFFAILISGSFASLKATFSFRRRTESYVSSVYIPTVILVVLSWCCFFISADAIPARIALSITTILTTILLKGEVNSNMPKVSYMKAVDYFILTSFGFIFAALVEYILVLNTDPRFSETFARFQSKLDWIRKRQNRNKKVILSSFYYGFFFTKKGEATAFYRGPRRESSVLYALFAISWVPCDHHYTSIVFYRYINLCEFIT